jgi:hypothetical protein
MFSDCDFTLALTSTTKLGPGWTKLRGTMGWFLICEFVEIKKIY